MIGDQPSTINYLQDGASWATDELVEHVARDLLDCRAATAHQALGATTVPHTGPDRVGWSMGLLLRPGG